MYIQVTANQISVFIEVTPKIIVVLLQAMPVL